MDKLKIDLYSTSDQIRSAIREAFKGAGYEVIEHTDGSKPERMDITEVRQAGAYGLLTLPDRVDAVVTRTNLNKSSEGLAATLALRQSRNDVYCYVLPEAIDALRAKLSKLRHLVIVGSDQAR